MRTVSGRLNPRRGWLRASALLCVGAVLVVVMGAVTAPAADHRDGPLFTNSMTQGARDINDLYVFQSPQNPSNTVLIVTTNPFAGPQSPVTFDPRTYYDLKIDNNGDSVEDLTFRFNFSAPDAQGVQQVTLRGLPSARFPRGGLIGRFRTNQASPAPVVGGGMVTAGVFDDPFFFDAPAFQRFLGANNGLPGTPLTQGAFRNPGRNFFGPTANILAMVLELPSTRLTANGPRIGAWCRTEINGVQVDRTALPAINTALIPGGPNSTPAVGPANRKQPFNQGLPRNDRRDFKAEVVTILGVLGNDAARSDFLANVVLPDIMPFDVTSARGFEGVVDGQLILNGRRLPDDVIDVELTILSNGAVTTDFTNNDSQFRNVFPYLGVANNPPGNFNP